MNSIVFDTSGAAKTVFADDLVPVCRAVGAVQIRRASHVEPDNTGQWWADLSPVCGPRLGPFPRRDAALSAEVDWLDRSLCGV